MRYPTAPEQNRLFHFCHSHSPIVLRTVTKADKKENEKEKNEQQRSLQQHDCRLSGPEVSAISVMAHFPSTSGYRSQRSRNLITANFISRRYICNILCLIIMFEILQNRDQIKNLARFPRNLFNVLLFIGMINR